jgi:hypothetical protein
LLVGFRREHMTENKPIFQNVVDLGLRELEVRNEPRRLVANLAKGLAILLPLEVLSIVGLLVIVTQTTVGGWIILPFLLAWVAGTLALMLRVTARSAPVVVRVGAERSNLATLLMLPSFLLLAAAAVLLRNPFLIPAVVLTGLMVVVAWRGRTRLPQALRTLRTLLASGESVLGDGIGIVREGRGRRASLRIIVATDRRLLVAGTDRSPAGLVVVDAPYRDMTRFGIEWKSLGRVGVLSLTVAGTEDTEVIGSIAPLNLLSIARALEAHGVATDDREAIEVAERAWEESRGRPAPAPLFDRAAMSTGAYDRGLWLLLALSGATLYLAPYGLGFWALAIIAALCVVCGYVAGTRASIAYIAPLNLLVTPVFLFAQTGGVLVVMVLLTLVAIAGLFAGAALRGEAPAESAPRSGLRYAISGLSLVRISSVLLAVLVTLVLAAAAVGYDPRTLRLALHQAQAKELRADGRSNLTGNAASLTYTPGAGLREFVDDEHFDAGPNDGARWELRTPVSAGDNVVSLAHYIFTDPRLDSPAAVTDFVAGKDDEHSRYAGTRVTHRKRVVDGRTGYFWTHESAGGYWHHVAWFPAPVHSIRVECVADTEVARFKRLCSEAIASLRFHAS